MNPDAAPALVSGVAVAVVGIAGALALALRADWRWRTPEAGAAIVVIAAMLAGVGGSIATLSPRIGFSLALLALLGSAARWGPRLKLGPAAVFGSMVFGGLPTTAVLLPACKTPEQAARTALCCTALGAASPLGGAAPLLVGASPQYFAWAALPALLAAAVAWPGALSLEAHDPPEHSALSRLLRLAATTTVIAAVLQAGGSARWLAIGLGEVAAQPVAPFLLGAAAGSVLEPGIAAVAAERTIAVGFLSTDMRSPMALGLSLAPVLPLALAASAYGRRVWMAGLPLAAIQLGIGAAWVMATL